MSEQAVPLPETGDDAACCTSARSAVTYPERVTLPLLGLWRRVDKAWLVIGLVPALLALIDPAQVLPTVRFAGEEILRTGVFIACAVLAVAFLRSTGAEALLSKAFTGPEVRMIALGALVFGVVPPDEDPIETVPSGPLRTALERVFPLQLPWYGFNFV